MTDRLIDRAELLSFMRQAGFRTQQEFAQAVGLSSPKLTNILKGTRRAQAVEAQRMAVALKVPLSDVLSALGIRYSEPRVGVYKVTGFVDDPDDVLIWGAGHLEFGSVEVALPFLGFTGTFLKVRTAALAPRYLDGEYIGIFVGAPRKFDWYRGEEVIAKVRNGRVVLRTLHPGSKPGRVTLLPLDSRAAPMIDAETDWVEPVLMRLPRLCDSIDFR